MGTYQFQTIFSGSSGLAKDKYVNNWHFYRAGAAPVTDYDNVRDMLKDFYLNTPSANAVRLYLAGNMSLTVQVKAYNLEDPKPRAPVYDSTFLSPGWAGAAPLPAEVALCLSFEAARSSGSPQSRRRNRVYLGPFATSVMGTAGRPVPSCITDMHNAAKRLFDAQAASATWDWVVYSGTDNETMPIQHIWIDDAFDTQRRRGLSPSTRTQIYY